VLPHQRELIESTEKYVGIVGGYGAGKTLPGCIAVILHSLVVPGNVWLVCRRSYSKLHDSTQRIFLEVLQRIGCGFQAREVRDGWPHRVILPNLSEVHFRETKDLGRFLGPEYGGFYIDEAAEEPRKTWTDLVGRLRLPHARKYLKGILTTNPPDEQHWIAELFGTEPGVLQHGGSSYRLLQVPTSANPYLPAPYEDDLRANNPESEQARIVDGRFGATYEGRAVLSPPFSYAKHSGAVSPGPFTLVRSWDFGWHSPAVLWHQFPQCAKRTVHWHILHEYKGKEMDAETLAGIVVEQTQTHFPLNSPSSVLDCGDAAGAQISDKGPGPIIRLQRKPFALRFKYRHLPNIDPGLSLLRSALGAPTCACGQQVVRIDHSCRRLLQAAGMGYHYPIPKPGRGGEPRMLKPVKDGVYDDLVDAWRYAGENVYRGLLRDPEAIATLMQGQERTQGALMPDPSKWAWMGAGVSA
jgi:hypothetical protein